ncbi:energy transducer TonB [Hymenobacter weizhouensis]|uniref:energy transducer TonB n=1 Tax=Hymenobacter sp. YIM 151500-1 TaxID=2987689 RepID=UPI0022261F5E|nr:energy transducer TonB [Hymenobacter sp. YIM 151500-1]UYZ64347.1 energy transducer TonB [Hymenobacter sp. YIM 151500-1]
MKKIFVLLSVGLLACSVPALAQKTKVKVKTDGPAPATTESTPDQGAPAAPASAPKTIPVAEYYEGGQEAMYAFIEKELKYPIMARRNRIQGQCIVSFTLNTDGTMSGVKLVKNIGGGCGEEALRVVRLLKFKKPDYAVLTSLPVTFKLPAPGQAAATE